VLYGREFERRTLSALLEGSRDGVSGAVILLGGPGAGKSALLSDLQAAATGTVVLTARGIESEAELPYAALHQFTRPLLGSLERLPVEQAGALRGAFGLGEGSDSDEYRVALAVLTLLAEKSEEQPVMCIVDDLHWLDVSSAQVLLFVARRLHAERVLMVFAAREDEVTPTGLQELNLGPLDVAATSFILADRSGATVVDDVAAKVTAATGGNPLAIVELASLLSFDQLAGREPLPSPLPLSAGVERLFADRVATLPIETRTLLLVAASDDTGAADVVFGAASRLGVDSGALEAAERAELVRVEGGELRFRHPLVRSAIYGTAMLSERQSAHRALAEVLKTRGEDDRFAWHLAAATVEFDPTVVAELERAAERARSREAFASAAAAYERAALLSEKREDRGRLLAEAAADAWRAGLLPRAGRLIQAAEPLVDDVLLLANCYRLRGAIELAVGTSTTTMPLLIEAARRTADVDPRRALELLALAGEAAALADDDVAGIAIGELAASLDIDVNARDGFFVALLVGFGHQFAGETAAALAAFREAIEAAADELDDPDLLLAAGRAGFYAGDDEAALRFNRRIVARARSIGSVGCLAIAGSRLAFAEILTGQWVSGLATAQETARLAEDTGQFELAAHAHAWQSIAAAWRGDSEAALAHVEQARASAEGHPMGLVDDATRWAMGIVELNAGRAGAADTQLRRITHPVISIASSLDRFEAALRAGNIEGAERVADELDAYARASEAPWARARIAHCRALLVKDAEVATGLFETAITEYTRATRPLEAGRAQLDYGSFLRRQRRRADARTPLRNAFEIFDALGATPWAERAQAELRATGETVRRREPAELGRLTPQELQVARFVAQGLSNREVAAQLFLSPRTIDFHLRNVFSKLGLTSRVELATLSLGTPQTQPASAAAARA
jgi:DNA-binding CsgD family transcriptional regulator/tetratricopeptide (TPR) repeat protein